jgi:hypothetical protein
MGLPNKFKVKHARVNATADGDNVVIAAASGKQYTVLGYAIGVNAAGVITFQDTTASPNIYASYELTDGGGVSFAGNFDCPAFEVHANKGFEVSTAAGVDALGFVTYVETDVAPG